MNFDKGFKLRLMRNRSLRRLVQGVDTEETYDLSGERIQGGPEWDDYYVSDGDPRLLHAETKRPFKVKPILDHPDVQRPSVLAFLINANSKLQWAHNNKLSSSEACEARLKMYRELVEGIMDELYYTPVATVNQPSQATTLATDPEAIDVDTPRFRTNMSLPPENDKEEDEDGEDGLPRGSREHGQESDDTEESESSLEGLEDPAAEWTDDNDPHKDIGNGLTAEEFDILHAKYRDPNASPQERADAVQLLVSGTGGAYVEKILINTG